MRFPSSPEVPCQAEYPFTRSMSRTAVPRMDWQSKSRRLTACGASSSRPSDGEPSRTAARTGTSTGSPRVFSWSWCPSNGLLVLLESAWDCGRRPASEGRGRASRDGFRRLDGRDDGLDSPSRRGGSECATIASTRRIAANTFAPRVGTDPGGCATLGPCLSTSTSMPTPAR